MQVSELIYLHKYPCSINTINNTKVASEIIQFIPISASPSANDFDFPLLYDKEVAGLRLGGSGAVKKQIAG